jgi:hypothetical protein
MQTFTPFFYLMAAALTLWPTCSLAIEPFEIIIPKLQSDAVPLTQDTATKLLEQECRGGVVDNKDRYFECVDSKHENDGLISAISVIYGHFLSPTSEDALVDGWGREMHPDMWGGSLLLTKKGNTWQRVWYLSGLRARHCSRVTLETGRDILVCENEDSGMGQYEHLLYTMDALSPQKCWETKLLVATSCEGACTCTVTQIESIDKIILHRRPRDGQVGLSIQVRRGQHFLTDVEQEACVDGKEVTPPPMKAYAIDFVLNGSKYEFATWSSEAAKLFIK